MSKTCATCGFAHIWKRWTGLEFVKVPCPVLDRAFERFKETSDGLVVKEETFYCGCYRPEDKSHEQAD